MFRPFRDQKDHDSSGMPFSPAIDSYRRQNALLLELPRKISTSPARRIAVSMNTTERAEFSASM